MCVCLFAFTVPVPVHFGLSQVRLCVVLQCLLLSSPLNPAACFCFCFCFCPAGLAGGRSWLVLGNPINVFLVVRPCRCCSGWGLLIDGGTEPFTHARSITSSTGLRGKSEMKDSDGRESWDKLQPSLWFDQETRLLTFRLTFSKQSKGPEGGTGDEAVYRAAALVGAAGRCREGLLPTSLRRYIAIYVGHIIESPQPQHANRMYWK